MNRLIDLILAIIITVFVIWLLEFFMPFTLAGLIGLALFLYLVFVRSPTSYSHRIRP